MNGPVEEPEGAAGTDHAAGFIEGLAPSVANQKMALAALRQFFDLLVTRHGALLNPFHSVRGPPMGSSDGKTPEITASQARRLLASIDCSRPVGLRDRAVIGTLHLHRRARRGGGQVPIPGPPRLRRIPDPPLPGKAREGAGDPAALGLGPLDRRVLRASPDPHHPKEVPLFRPAIAAVSPSARLAHGPSASFSSGGSRTRYCRTSSRPIASGPWSSPIYSPRASPSRTFNTWLATPTRPPPRFTTGAPGRSPETSWNGSPSDGQGCTCRGGPHRSCFEAVRTLPSPTAPSPWNASALHAAMTLSPDLGRRPFTVRNAIRWSRFRSPHTRRGGVSVVTTRPALTDGMRSTSNSLAVRTTGECEPSKGKVRG